MGKEEYSPDPDISIRTPGRPLPTFSGLALPTPLRALYKHHEDALSTPHPSELTALATRLRSIRLDVSPTPDPNGPERAAPKPTKLDFGEHVESDKENVDNGRRFDHAKPPRTPKKVGSGLFAGSPASDVGEEQRASLQNSDAREPSLTPRTPSLQKEDNTADVETDGSPPSLTETPTTQPTFSSPAAQRTEPDVQELHLTPQNSEASASNHSVECQPGDDADSLPSGGANIPEQLTERIEPSPTTDVELHPEQVTSDTLEQQVGSVQSEQDDTEQDDTEQDASESAFLSEQLQILLEGKDKWSWPKRCEAMTTVSQALVTSPSDRDIATVREAIASLSNAVNDNLDELRPSIINSALRLINSVLISKADSGSNFAEDVFPSVMDISCGRSLTAREAARCIALMLQVYPGLSNILEDADNPDRLIELLQLDVDEESALPETQNRAKLALPLVRQAVHGEASVIPHSPEGVVTPAAQNGSSQASNESATPVQCSTNTNSPASAGRVESGTDSAEKTKSSSAAQLTDFPSPSGSDLRTPRLHRLSERLGPTSSSEFKATKRQSLRANLADIRLNTPLIRNKKLGNSIRKISPLSGRKKRTYTEEDIAEARSAAIRVVMEESAQREAKLRAEYQKERTELEKKFLKEQSLAAELNSVLTEYEQTMQKMISQGNSQASAYCTSLEKETKRLKAELLEVTEAYESVKERYDSGKQAIKVYENKETRFIEHIRTLKNNFGELQKWSDDLKANCEKKLANAFSQVTTFRTSYMEAEAHRNKATVDLNRVQLELTKSLSDRAKIVATLSTLEASLHQEEDKTSSLETSLSSMKDSLERITAQKERLEREVSSAHEQLKKTSSQLAELEDARTRADQAIEKLQKDTAERQALKARAYDDLTRIRELENELQVKDREYEDLSNLCDEACSQLEKIKSR